MKDYIFISYAHKDVNEVMPVINKLKENEYRVWYDDEIHPGSEWPEIIAEHLVECKVFFAFITPNYLKSKNCKRELTLAQNKGKDFVAIFLEEVTLSHGMELQLAAEQSVYMYKAPDKDVFYRKLFVSAGIETCKDEKESVTQEDIETEDKSFECLEAEELVTEVVDAPSPVVEVEEPTKKSRNILYKDDGKQVTVVGCQAGTKNLTIPEKIKGMPVVAIGAQAFMRNAELVTVKLPESVTEIKECAFQDCEKLKSIEGICRVCVIAADAFDGCTNLEKTPLQKEAWEWLFEIEEFVDGIIITKYIGDVKDVVIPNMINGKPVTKIAAKSFEGCSGLVSIEIPECMTEIEFKAFLDCSGLTKIIISESVTKIGCNAFNGCYNLKSVKGISATCVIEADAFYGCNKLERTLLQKKVVAEGFEINELKDSIIVGRCIENKAEIKIPYTINGKPVTKIADEAFVGCTGLISIEIPESVTEIGSKAFFGCSGLVSARIPKSVTEMGYSTFEGCTGLISIEIPESVTEIGTQAFFGCSGLTSVRIPKSVKKIWPGVFKGCTGLISVEIPEGVTDIWWEVFEGCTSLISVEIPESVTRIWARAFKNCCKLTNVEGISKGCEIDAKAFDGCEKLVRNPLKEWERNFRIKEHADGITIASYIGDAAEVVIPDTIKGKPVNGIDKWAFKGCSELISVVIPESVTEIGDSAFADCYNLEQITIPNSATKIEKGTFRNCRTLSKITIPNSVIVIEGGAFEGCSCLSDIILPESVTEIGDEAFRRCWRLKSISMPSTVKRIGLYAFCGCDNLSVLDIPSGITRIEEGTFRNCISLISVTIPDNVKEIKRKAFEGCLSLKCIMIPKSVIAIGEDAFWGCGNVVQIEGAENVPKKYLVDLYQRAVENGSIDAQYELAEMYMRENGVERNVEKALELYRSAALNDHVGAQYGLLCIYLEGQEVGLDEQKLGEFFICFLSSEKESKREIQAHGMLSKKTADLIKYRRLLILNSIRYKSSYNKLNLYKLYQDAAERGNEYAQCWIAAFWKEKNDLSKAIAWYEKAAKQGDQNAQEGLGKVYEEKCDIHKAIWWYEKALLKDEQIRLGKNNAVKNFYVALKAKQCIHLAELYTAIHDWTNVVKHYRTAADNNNVEAQCKVAFFALAGIGIETNLFEAVEWYKKAANNKYTSAEFALAMLCFTGRGVEQDFVKAYILFQGLAVKGHSIANLMLALMYGTGRGVERNDEKARQFCEKACEKGKWNNDDIPLEISNQYRLTETNESVNRIFQDVDVLQDDLALAIEWHKDAAKEGNAVVCCNLGYIYEQGWGVSQDKKRAMEWYQKAIDLGDTNAVELLKSCKKTVGLGKIFGIFS